MECVWEGRFTRDVVELLIATEPGIIYYSPIKSHLYTSISHQGLLHVDMAVLNIKKY